MLFRQCLGPGPDPRRNHFVIDLFAQRLDVVNGDPCGQCQGRIPHGMDIVDVFPARHELELLPREAGGLGQGERSALVHLPRHMEEAGSAHQGVVHVEERRFAWLRLGNRARDYGDVFLLGHGLEYSQSSGLPPSASPAARERRYR